MLQNSRVLQSFYEAYKDEEVVLSQSVVEKTGLQNKILIRSKTDSEKGIGGILYSISMHKVKALARLKDEEIQEFSRNGNKATLNLVSLDPKTEKTESLLVKVKLLGISSYPGKHPDLFLLVFELNQTTPPLLIYKIGSLLKSKEEVANRSHERIILNKTTLPSLNISSQKALAKVGNHSFSCILLDISLGGLKVFVSREEVSSYLNPEVVISIPFVDGGTVSLQGKVIRSDTLSNRDGYLIWAIQLDPERIPTEYTRIVSRQLKD